MDLKKIIVSKMNELDKELNLFKILKDKNGYYGLTFYDDPEEQDLPIIFVSNDMKKVEVQRIPTFSEDAIVYKAFSKFSKEK